MKTIKRIRLVSYIMAGVFAYIFMAGVVQASIPGLLECHDIDSRGEHCHSERRNVVVLLWPVTVPIWYGIKAGARIFDSGTNFINHKEQQ